MYLIIKVVIYLYVKIKNSFFIENVMEDSKILINYFFWFFVLRIIVRVVYVLGIFFIVIFCY